MSKPAVKTKAAAPSTPQPTSSKLRKGSGTKRGTNRIITIYGPFKSRKTSSLAKLLKMGRCKLIASDSNCVSRDTRFITSMGVKSFEDFEGGEELSVRTHTGYWQKAVVGRFGKQDLYEVVFGRGPNKQVVRATADHRWLLHGGAVVCTKHLAEGVKLLRPPMPLRDWSFDDAPEEEQVMWMRGFIWGDGSVALSHGKELGSKVRLCGEKARFAERFAQRGTVTHPDSSEGEPNVYLPSLFKRMPPKDISPSLLVPFVRGLLDADGTKNMRDAVVNPFTGIQATGEETITFIREMFPVAGAYITKERDLTDEVTNYGPRGDKTVFFQFTMGFSDSPVGPYIVRSVSKEPVASAEVWCLQVKEDQSFLLPCGIVTGNCVPTLRALEALPHEDDIYEPGSVSELREILEEALTICETDGADALGIDRLIVDSWTQFSDWHQQSVAKDTGQRFLGDDKANNGWQQFNAEFGACLDLVVALSRYVTIIGIVHAKPKFDAKKGEYSSFSLSPAMAERLGRISNWILLKDFNEVVDDAKIAEAKESPDDPYYSIEDGIVYEDIFYTKPINGWVASANTLKLKSQEPGKDLCILLEKDGLL